jgi:hypothetical protein
VAVGKFTLRLVKAATMEEHFKLESTKLRNFNLNPSLPHTLALERIITPGPYTPAQLTTLRLVQCLTD